MKKREGKTIWNKLLISLSVLLALLLILLLSVVINLNNILSENNITIDSWEFSLSGEITLKNIQWEPSDSLEIYIEKTNIKWNWSELRNIKYGDSVKGWNVSYLEIESLNSDIKNEKLTVKNSLNSMRLSNIYFGETIGLDSLILNGIYLDLEQMITGQKVDTTASSFSLDQLPNINIRFIELSDNNIHYTKDTTDIQISDLYFQTRNLSNFDLTEFSIDSIGLNFQDTLQIAGHIEDGKVLEDLSSIVNDSRIDLPGIELDFDYTFEASKNSHRILLRRSYVELGLIRFLTGNLDNVINAKLPNMNRFFLDGEIEYKGDSVYIDHLKISTLENTVIPISGNLAFKDGLMYSANVEGLQTTGSDLYKLLADYPFLQAINWPGKGNIDAVISGSSKDLSIIGILDSDIGLLSPHLIFQFEESAETPLTITGTAKNLNVGKLLVPLDEYMTIDKLNYIVKTGQTLSIEAQLKSLLSDYANISLLDTKWVRQGVKQSVDLYSEIEELSLSLKADAIFGDEIHADYQISADGKWPESLRKYANMNALILSMNGDLIRSAEGILSNKTRIDKISLATDNKQNYTLENVDLEYLEETESRTVDLGLEGGQFLSATVTKQLNTETNEELLAGVKDLNIEFWLPEEWGDEMIIYDDTISVKNEKLHISKNENQWDVNIKVPHLSYSVFEINGFQYEMSGELYEAESNLQLDSMYISEHGIKNLQMSQLWQDSVISSLVQASVNGDSTNIRLPLIIERTVNDWRISLDENNLIQLGQYFTVRQGLRNQFSYNPTKKNLKGALDLYRTEDKSFRRSIIGIETEKKEEKQALLLKVDSLNLKELNELVSTTEKLEGYLNLMLDITLGDDIVYEGSFSLDSGLLKHPDWNEYYSIPHLEAKFNKDIIDIPSTRIFDSNEGFLELNGSLDYNKNGFPYKASINFSELSILRGTNLDGRLSGNTHLDGNIEIVGDTQLADIAGKVTVENTELLNVVSSEKTIFTESDSEIIFTDFKDSLWVEKEIILKNKVGSFLSSSPIRFNWDVEIEIPETEFELIFSEVTQEYARLIFEGDLQFLGNTSENLPAVYGTIGSEQGNVFYSVPAVEDVNLQLRELIVAFTGDIRNPRITFEGTERFTTNAANLDERFKETGYEEFDVVIKMDGNELNNLEPIIDLESPESSLNNFLQSNTAETRAEYALSLLLWGEFKGDVDASMNSFDVLNNKLNEIAHRNFKKSQLNFNVSTREKETNPQESNLDVGYRYEQNFLENKLKVTIGGDVSFEGESGGSNFEDLLKDVEISYQLRKDPEILLKGHREINRGYSAGSQSIESSIGFGFRKSFDHFFKKSTEKDEK